MTAIEPRRAALEAVKHAPGRPATATLHESDDCRLVVFRIEPGEEVKAHRSPSSVVLEVLEGAGTIAGERDGATEERRCSAGDVVVFAPNEVHAMRSTGERMLLLATITPRPGTR